MENVGLKIIKNFKRPEKSLIEKFRNIQVSILDDCMNRTAAISSQIKPFNNVKLLGTAYTVRLQAGDNLLFYYAIDQAKPGDVIVIDGGGFTERALCGEIMTEYAKERGLAGFIIDGAIRDKEDLSKSNFPVYARAVTPNGPYKNGPGEINVPINIGGKVICPGDIIVGDENGVIAINPKDAEIILEKSKAIIEKENNLLLNIKENKKMNLEWVYKKLEENQCEFIEEV